DLHTAHPQGREVVVHYPYHPLYGQRATVRALHNCDGVAQYRLVTASGHERLVPQWMCEPQAFDPTSVTHPFIDLRCLLDLQRLVASAIASWESPAGQHQEDKHEPAATVPTSGDSDPSTGRRPADAGPAATGRPARRRRGNSGGTPNRPSRRKP